MSHEEPVASNDAPEGSRANAPLEIEEQARLDTAKKRAQNRIAQRKFRERNRRYIPYIAVVRSVAGPSSKSPPQLYPELQRRRAEENVETHQGRLRLNQDADRSRLNDEDIDHETGQLPTREVLAVEEFDIHELVDQRRPSKRQCLLIPIAALEVILAPVAFVADMMAEHSDSWKYIFVGIFSGWVILLAIGLYVDLHSLTKAHFLKRSLSHLFCCILMWYIIASTTQANADTLPQWIPLIIDCGLGVSLDIQSISSNDRHQLWGQLNELVGSFCGGVQVRL